MSSARRLQPFRQGELDGLCGIYAIINAIRLALGDQEKHYHDEHWRDLFHALLLDVDDTLGAANATVCGITTKPFRRLLRCAVRHMVDEHEVQLSAGPLISGQRRPPTQDVLAAIAETLATPRFAVMVCFEGFLDHWTVVRRVSQTSLELFDSFELTRVSTANCRMKYEPAVPAKRQHIIDLRAAFSVWVDR